MRKISLSIMFVICALALVSCKDSGGGGGAMPGSGTPSSSTPAQLIPTPAPTPTPQVQQALTTWWTPNESIELDFGNYLEKETLIGVVTKDRKIQEIMVVQHTSVDLPIYTKDSGKFEPAVQQNKIDGQDVELSLSKTQFSLEWALKDLESGQVSSSCVDLNDETCLINKVLNHLEARGLLPNQVDDISTHYNSMIQPPWEGESALISTGYFALTDRFDPVDLGEKEENQILEKFVANNKSNSNLKTTTGLLSAKVDQVSRLLFNIGFNLDGKPLVDSDDFVIKYQVLNNHHAMSNTNNPIYSDSFARVADFSNDEFMSRYPNGRHSYAVLYTKGADDHFYPTSNTEYFYLDHYEIIPEEDFKLTLSFDDSNLSILINEFYVSAELDILFPVNYGSVDMTSVVYGPSYAISDIIGDGFGESDGGPQRLTGIVNEQAPEGGNVRVYVRNRGPRSFYLTDVGTDVPIMFGSKITSRNLLMVQEIKIPIYTLTSKHVELKCEEYPDRFEVEINSPIHSKYKIEWEVFVSGGTNIKKETSWKSGQAVSFTLPRENGDVLDVFPITISYEHPNGTITRVKDANEFFSKSFSRHDCGF